MKHFITASMILMFASKVMAHSSHYEGLKKIEMDVLRNNEIIGSTSYFFEFDEDLFVVKNYTNFKVELFGVTVFSILSETIEKPSIPPIMLPHIAIIQNSLIYIPNYPFYYKLLLILNYFQDYTKHQIQIFFHQKDLYHLT